jgi:hypothetical protein
MTDRKLLELAAKAAGIEIPKPNPWFTYNEAYGFTWMNMDGSAVEKQWNPLEDDGDALRLAVRLQIEIGFTADEHVWCFSVGEPTLKEALTVDPFAATRRAIVRAAAEIGRAMP